MSKWWNRSLVVIAVACGVLLAVAIAVRTFLPSWLRDTVERVAKEAIGRELTIAGPIHLSFSRTPALVARNVTLSNAPWGSGPYLVRASRIRIAVDLVSLWSGPIRVHDVELDDVTVSLERDRDGRNNWTFPAKPASVEPERPQARRPFKIVNASIRGLALTYRTEGRAHSTSFAVSELKARLDPSTDRIDIHGDGRLDDVPWDLAGGIGRFDDLVEARDVEPEISGHIGQTAFSVSGRIHDPLTLDRPNVEVSLEGPDVVAALAIIGLTSRASGPFSVHGVVDQAGDEVGVEIRAKVGDVTATARGTVGKLFDPSQIDSTVGATGPDASVVGWWTGLPGLPKRPFELKGRIRRDGPRVACDALEVRVGTTSLSVNGTLGEPPRCVGADLRVVATGSNLGDLSELTRLRLPARPYSARGRFLRNADGLAIDGARVQVGRTLIEATGTIGQPPKFDNLELMVRGSGPDASLLSGIAHFELPAEPFELTGGITRKAAALELDGVAGRLGGIVFDASGRLVPVSGLVGTDAQFRVTGDDLAKAASLFGAHGLPSQPFRVTGRGAVEPDGYGLQHVDATVGPIVAIIDGRLGAPSPRNGTSLSCRVRGQALADLAAWGVDAKLPSDPFAVTGTLRVDNGIFSVSDVSGEIGAEHLGLYGTLGALPDTSALDVAVSAEGPSFAGLLGLLTSADRDHDDRIPTEPYAVSGRLAHAPSGFAVREARATIGAMTITADGTVVSDERMLGTDLTVEAEAPDSSMLSRLIGAPLPEQAVRARGRIARVDRGFRLDGVSVTLGPSYAEASGTLGEPPRFEETDLEVSFEGPDLASVLGPPTGLAPLPADSFSLSAHIEGSNVRMASDRFTARIGSNDLEGRVSIELGPKPFVEADLRAKKLDVPALIAGFGGPSEAGDAPMEPAKKGRSKKGLLIPDQPISLGALRRIDGRLRLAAEMVQFPGVSLRDVGIEGDLRDGSVTIPRFEGTGEKGGRATASFSLEPHSDGYRMQTSGNLDGGRLALMTKGLPTEKAPTLDVEYDLRGTGKSLHEIAASADGWALLILGPGQVSNTMTEFASSDVMLALFDALNPFRKSSPYTSLECGVAGAGIESGKAVVKPIAVRSDKLTVLGSGKVDFKTEAIDLVWTLKSRRGIGLSGASIANPYIKLDGTLASPTLDIKPLEAITSTGAAVATAGLTLLFRGIYDRITAEKKVCASALAKARERIDARPAR